MDYKKQINATAAGQFPCAVVLGCIDSRVPAEIIFGQGIGDIFNIRVAGNVLNDDVIGSMEFACKLAGAKLIVVLGHTRCGAVRGACGDLSVVDVGTLSDPAVRRGTRNFAREPAMTEDEMDAAIEIGRCEARRLESAQLLGLGEMGIGNTTAASAITAALTGLPVAEVTGRGTGVDEPGLRRKVAVIERALALHEPKTPRAILASVGGLEIAALVGVCLEAARLGRAILVDGFITTAACAVAWKLEPAVRDYAFFSHVSVEPGHKALHQMMDVRPLLDLELRLGEGTGAALAIPIMDAAVAVHNEMATFESAGVSDKTP